MPFVNGAISQRTKQGPNSTYSDVERLEPIAGGRTERENLGASVRNADLEVTVRIFLFKDKTYRLLDIYEESAWGRVTLLVVGHSARLDVPIVFKNRALGSMAF